MAELEADFELLPREPLEATFEINVAEKGDKGDTGNGIESIEKTSTQGLVDTYTIQYTDGNSTTFDVTNGKDGTDGKDGADGKDATINGVNTLTLNTIYGISFSQEGNTATLSGKEITDAVDRIDSLIPAQATEQNQLADKNFVNSSIATNTANFIGTFDSVEELEAYSGTLTNNDYAFVVGTDSAGNTVYDRYKYTTATDPASWQFEYELNNSSFTADQWAAINSKATESKINQIETNKTAIGTLSSLTTTDKSNLVGAVNELNNKKLDKVTGSTSVMQAYVKNANGTQGMTNIVQNSASGSSIPIRTSSGTIYTATPTNDDEATNKNYVDSALQGKADTSLSNLTDTGKNVGNWSSNISNCIVEIPQDIKLGLSNGTLTLKSGSVITKPDGTQLILTIDRSTTQATDGTYLVCPSASGGQIQARLIENCVSGAGATTAGGFAYNTTTNKINNYSAGGEIGGEYALPVGIVTVSNGTISSIDKVFNGAGYIGHHAFVLPDVKALAPNGHNEDGSLKSYNPTVSSLQIIEMRNPSYETKFYYPISISFDGAVGRAAYRVVNNNTELLKQVALLQYVKEDNLVQLYRQNTDSFSPQSWTPFVYYNWDGTSVTKFEVRQVVRFATKEMLRGEPNYYGTCSTAASTQTKDVVCDGFELKTGVGIRVKFTNNQNYNGNPLLNVNGTGAISIKQIGTTSAGRYEWDSGEVLDFTYDGTYWIMDNGGIATTTYYGRTKLVSTATSAVTNQALAPAALNATIQNMIEPYVVYSTSSTYKVGDRVRYGWQVWECNTAITTAEAWNANHWTVLPAIQDQLDITNNRVSNVITEIPQDIKLELNNGTLTLKSGSVITAPDGSQVITTQDRTFTESGNQSYSGVLFVAASSGAIQGVKAFSVVSSGTTDPVNPNRFDVFYNSTTNKIRLCTTNDGTWIDWAVALPLAICTVTSGVITSIDQVFNGIGFIGTAFFALPGMSYLFADGLNTDGTLKSGYKKLTSLVIRNFSVGNNTYTTWLNHNGGFANNYASTVYYNAETNHVVSSNADQRGCIVVNWTQTGGIITDFNVRPVYRDVTDEMLDTELQSYSEKTSVITLEDSSTITLADNTIYNGGTLTALTVNVPVSATASFISQFNFTSGATATTLTSTNIVWTGDDTLGGAFTPVASKRYTCMVYYDGVQFVGVSIGV